ncbi:hypothetical protein DJ480_11460 [Pseudomonas sp. Leaf98]|nr:hypothetical protein DJ480_11460 [Pseudomonas sp. Leaf98]
MPAQPKVQSARQKPIYLMQRGLNVGAGLPAMQTPRCVRYTELMPSQASQLPQLTEYGSAVAVAVAVAPALTSFSMTKSAVF